MSIFKDIFSSSGGSQRPEKQSIPPEETAVLEKVAKKVVSWRMTVPAVLFLESVKPLNYIGSQALVFFEPIIQSVFSIKDYDTFRIAMERRENVENLIQIIEKYDAVAHKKEKLYKKKLKGQRKYWKWYQRYLGIKQPRIEIDPAELETIEKEMEENGGENQSVSGN